MRELQSSKWIRHGQDDDEVHEAVFESASSVMLKPDGGFPLDKFLERVEELAKTKNGDDI